MASRGRVKAIAQRTRNWVRETAPSPDSDSDVTSLESSSDEDESDEEPQRFQSRTTHSDSSPCKSPEFGTGGLNDNETISDDVEASDGQDKARSEAAEENDERSEDHEDIEASDVKSEVGEGRFPGYKE